MAVQLTVKQKRVLTEARNRLQKEVWFRGINPNDVPADDEIIDDNEGFNEAVFHVMKETAAFDAPDGENWKPKRG